MKVQFFRLLSALMKVHPMPYAIFKTTRSGFIQILHPCSGSSHNSSVFLQLKTCILWTKRAHLEEIFRLLGGWLKIHLIPHVIFETTRQLFFKLSITLWCNERLLFCTFLADIYLIQTKGTHQSAELQTLDCSPGMSPNLYFDRLLLLKVYKISAKKVQRIYVSWQ